ncbi:NAD-dependent epimerase/dehydratase family protein [Amycolatopsis sp. cmx-4-83]|uniref:NAD-dependent epimerase/dehydratase family protein n=1 Tax=Amycolatopsis sp. cmx-4-83 TaxID=2790940 RepID=UPI00397DC41B
MRVLVLGGGVFAGRAVAERGLAEGWRVTAFNRDPRALPGVEHLRGDRTADVSALAGRQWDLVVDTWLGPPEAVERTARLLSGSVDRYAYVSSLTVYADPLPKPLDESAPLLPGASADYPHRKAAAERAVAAHFGDRALVVRTGLLLGPHERVGRLPWWLLRLRDGAPVPAPAPVGRQVQFADVRDLAVWVLSSARAGTGGAYNFACPPGHATMGSLLGACRTAVGAGELRWIDERVLLATGVRPWVELPLWIPVRPDAGDVYCVDTSRVAATGALFRPLEETVEDTWRWLVSAEPVLDDRPWLTRSAQARVLAAHS